MFKFFKGIALVTLTIAACVVYLGVGFLFHYFIKGDTLELTSSTIGIVVAWPFIAMALFFAFGVAILILVGLWLLYNHFKEEREHQKRREEHRKKMEPIDKILFQVEDEPLNEIKKKWKGGK